MHSATMRPTFIIHDTSITVHLNSEHFQNCIKSCGQTVQMVDSEQAFDKPNFMKFATNNKAFVNISKYM